MLSACSNDDGEKTVISETPQIPNEVAEYDLSYYMKPLTINEAIAGKTLQQFSFNLMKQMAEQGGNVMFSPYTIGKQIWLLTRGTAGACQTKMLDALGINMNQTFALDDYFGKCKRIYTGSHQKQILCLSPDIPVYASFYNDCHNLFSTDVKTVRFDDKQAGQTVNEWFSTQTGGAVNYIVPAGKLPYRILLAGTAEYELAWSVGFGENTISQGAFHNEDGSNVRVPVMKEKTGGQYLSEAQYEMALYPTGVGEQCFVVCLPREGVSLHSILKDMSMERWMSQTATMTAMMNSEKVSYLELCLPQFSLDYDMRLASVMQEQGASAIFDPKQADLSRMTTKTASVSEMLHRGTMQLNEHGINAEKAAKYGNWRNFNRQVFVPDPYNPGLDDLEEPDFIPFDVNRPFLFSVQDDTTILYMGIITCL